MKSMNAKQVTEGARRENGEMPQEDFQWLTDLRDALSPYWSARLEYRPARVPVLALQGLRAKGR